MVEEFHSGPFSPTQVYLRRDLEFTSLKRRVKTELGVVNVWYNFLLDLSSYASSL